MTNVMAELQYALDKFCYRWEDIEWAHLNNKANERDAIIKPGYSKDDMDKFKEDIINMGQYDDGYGGQELFGDVVFKDGTWLSRGEYDGSEWWHYNIKPTYDAYIKDLGRD